MVGSSGNNGHWWQTAVFYQIYPLSFADSNGDGYGDLEGVISKLDYLSSTLGVDAIWLSPFFKSPMADWGYDIADHTDVDPLFGDLATAERLIEEVHRRGMRLILDYVMNHTSDQHPWFDESRTSRTSAKRDWYVWRDPKSDGSPPNNWVSVFGGPAWALDSETGQYYRHTFLPEQPDLNWRNPEVVDAMLDVARFWLDRGVDGFRVDAAHQIMKDPEGRDNPPTPHDYVRPWKDMGEFDRFVHLYDLGHSDVHSAHRRFREVLDLYPQDPMSVGEIHVFDLSEWASYYGEKLDQLSMPFNFHLMASGWGAAELRVTIEAVLWHIPVGGWTNWTFGNHDEIRLATRVGEPAARLAALLMLTLRGTPFIYYGDELGMVDTEEPVEDIKDPWGINQPFLNRDGCRSPMQWSAAPDAGFGSNEPWLPLAPDHERRNVEVELADPSSMLNLYRKILEIRRGSPALRFGSYLSHPESRGDVLAYRRESDTDTKTVVLNLSDDSQRVRISPGRVLVSTSDPTRTEFFAEGVDLSPYEGVLIGHD